MGHLDDAAARNAPAALAEEVSVGEVDPEFGQVLVVASRSFAQKAFYALLCVGAVAGGAYAIYEGTYDLPGGGLAAVALVASQALLSRERKRLLVLGDRGIRHAPHGPTILWADVVEVYYAANQTYVNGIPTPTQHKLTLHAVDGRRLAIKNGWQGIDVRCQEILSLLAPLLLALKVGELERTGEARFGPLTLTSTTLRSKGWLSERTVPLANVKSAYVESGYICVYETGRWRASVSCALSSVPNAIVLMSMLDALLSPAEPAPPQAATPA